MQQEMIGTCMFGKDHPRMGQPWTNGMASFSTTAALMAKYGYNLHRAASKIMTVKFDVPVWWPRRGVALTAIICARRLLQCLILSAAAAHRSSSMERARARAARCVFRR